MAAVTTFMQSPLVTWIRTFNSGEEIDYLDLCDGVYLNDVLMQIDERDSAPELDRLAKDTNARLQNWARLLQRLKGYYQEMLQQLLIGELPNIVNIVKYPMKESSVRDVEKVLLLLLGCAVQCHLKENFINMIKQMDISVQTDMKDYIEQITDTCEYVVGLDLNPEMETEESYKMLYKVLRSVVRQRDTYAENLWNQTQECDYMQLELKGKNGLLTPPPALESYHLTKERDKYRNQVNNLQEDVEDREKVISDLKDEIEMLKFSVSKIRNENLLLIKDANAARTYRDELDILRDKAMKADKYEHDIKKFKDKLTDLDFYKARVEELKEENEVISDAKTKMEDIVTLSNRRVEKLKDEVEHTQMRLTEANKEKEEAQQRIQALAEENSTLMFEHSNMSEGGMRRITSFSSAEFLSRSGSQISIHPISDELNDTMASRLNRVELENEEVQRELEETKLQLSEAQQELDKLRLESEQHLQQRRTELETETSEIRRRTMADLSRDYAARIEEIEQKRSEQQKRIMMQYETKIRDIETRNAEQQKQYVIKIRAVEARANEFQSQRTNLQDLLYKEQQRNSLLEKVNQDHGGEKAHLREAIQNLQQNSEQHIQQLEKELESSKTKNSSLSKEVADMKVENERLNERVSMRDSSFIDSECDSLQGDGTDSESSSCAQYANQGPGYMYTHPPARVAVPPQPRAVPGAFVQNSRFARGDPSRQTIAPVRRKILPFARDSRLRASMPEKKMAYVAPERQPAMIPSESSSSIASNFSSASTLSAASTISVGEQRQINSLRRAHPLRTSSPLPEGTRYQTHSMVRGKGKPRANSVTFSQSSIDSSTESGYPGSVNSSQRDDEKENHVLTGFGVVTSDLVASKLRKSGRSSAKTKELQNKIAELQRENQKLFADNEELKKNQNSAKFDADRVERLEKQIQDLTVENQKLKKILESLGSNVNPHDSKIYHYYSYV